MTKEWKEDLKKEIRDRVDDAVSASNTAIATNIGKGGTRTSVTSRQRVVQRDGKTTKYEERIERRET
jgi:hypothetical protein